MNDEPDFTIHTALNGVIVEYPSPNTEGTITEVFEYDDEQPRDAARLSELEMAEKVVYTLLEAMGWSYNKHAKYNLIVQIEGREE